MIGISVLVAAVLLTVLFTPAEHNPETARESECTAKQRAIELCKRRLGAACHDSLRDTDSDLRAEEATRLIRRRNFWIPEENVYMSGAEAAEEYIRYRRMP